MKKGDRVRILRSGEIELVGKYATVIYDTNYGTIIVNIDVFNKDERYEHWTTTFDKLELLKARIIKVI